MAALNEQAISIFMIFRRYVVEIAKNEFMKEHGRQPGYENINNLKILGPGYKIEIDLEPEDFEEEEDEDETADISGSR